MAGAKKTPEKQKMAAGKGPQPNQPNQKSMKANDEETRMDEDDEDEDFEDDEDEDEDEEDLADDDDEDDEAETGTKDTDYNLVSVLYHSLQGAETYAEYADDAADADDKELESFFRDVQREESKRADRAKQLLGTRLMRGRGQTQAQQRPGATKSAPM